VPVAAVGAGPVQFHPVMRQEDAHLLRDRLLHPLELVILELDNLAAALAYKMVVTVFIRLAFLAPGIVESIVEGRQPSDLTAEALTRHTAIPIEWRSQRAALNFR
jgi:hypothetical protein